VKFCCSESQPMYTQVFSALSLLGILKNAGMGGQLILYLMCCLRALPKSLFLPYQLCFIPNYPPPDSTLPTVFSFKMPFPCWKL
jgi:hypothetical protein